jgi:chromosome segregation ATPase
MLEDKLRSLDTDHARLHSESTKVDQDLVHEEKRFRQLDSRLNDLIRSKESLLTTLDKANLDLSNLRKAIGDLRNDCMDKDTKAADLKIEIQKLEDEYADIEDDNARHQDELNRLKDVLADEADKNASLLETISSLEKGLANLNNELNRLRSDLSYIEEKYARSNSLNADYVAILEELKRAIEELTHQNKLVCSSNRRSSKNSI